MKKKKLLSAAMVAGLTAAQLAMPVAAADGGSYDVTVDIKTGVIRVEVPTMIEISIDQFEMGGKSQIFSEDFSMLNKSPLPVRVEVESTATAAASFQATKAAAEAGSASEVWMAMAAATSKANDVYSYDDASTEAAEAVRDLSDTSANVTTFDATNKKAKQVFYLAAGAATMNYKVADVATAGSFPVSYAQFYAITTTADLNAASGTDVLVDTTGQKITAAAASTSVVELGANDTVIQFVKKGETSTKGVTAGNKVYAVVDTVTVANGTSAPAVGKYLYSESTTAAANGGEAAFSYVGKLSSKDVWEVGSGKDLEKINIKYDIYGTGEAVYTELAGDLVYGYYTAPAAPSITGNTTVVATAGQPVEFTVDLGKGSQGASSIVAVAYGEGDAAVNIMSNDLAVFEDGKLTITKEAVDFLFEKQLLSATDATKTVTLTVAFSMNDSNAEVATIDITLKGKN